MATAAELTSGESTLGKIKFAILTASCVFQMNCKTDDVDVSAVKYETDQYAAEVYFLDSPIKDSSDVVNETINLGFQTVIQRWKSGRSPEDFPSELAEYFSHQQIEVWTIDHPRISSFLPGTEKSIYRGHDYLSPGFEARMTGATGYVRTPLVAALKAFRSPIISKKGLSTNINIGGIEFGADKLDHFFGLGGYYYEEYRSSLQKQLKVMGVKSVDELDAEARKKILDAAMYNVITFGIGTEDGKWGKGSTGVYSNGDLVANYQGFEMLRAIAEDKSPYVGWTADKMPYLKKPFDLRDIVNHYWNESMNPSDYLARLAPFVISSLYQYCTVFRETPERFVASDWKQLEERFSRIGLTPLETRRRFRLDYACDNFDKLPEEERQKYRQIKRSSEINPADLVGKTHGLFFYDDKGDVIKDDTVIKEKLRASVSKLPGCTGTLESAISEFDAIQVAHEAHKADAEKRLGTPVTDRIPPLVVGRRPESTCVTYPVTGPGVRKNVKLHLEYCKEEDGLGTRRYGITYDNKFFKALEWVDPFFNSVVDGHYEYVSNPGYYEFDSLLGYVYRGVPVHCRWY